MSVDSKMTAIADAIREKGGTTDLLTLDGMAAAIAAIEAGGGGASIDGYNVQAGTFVLAEDVSNTGVSIELSGEFEENKAYTVFMGMTGVYSSLSDVVGKNGLVGSASKRFNTSNNNTISAAAAFDSYGSTAAVRNCGLYKNYSKNHLSLTGSSSAKAKAGVEYAWVAIEDGV